MLYVINPECVLHWQTWGDEHVVFDESSGQTHQLDSLRAFVLNALETGGRTVEMLLEDLVASTSTADLSNLSSVLITVLTELGSRGLVEAIAR